MTDDPEKNGGPPVLVIGGGISGLSAAVEASEAGKEVILLERNPYLGGRVVQMSKYFPKLCPPTCGVEIHLKRLRTTPRVRLLTGAELVSISGSPGAFTAEIRVQPRGVNESCTSCGECVKVCPRERPNEFNYGLDATKAIYLPFGAAFPSRFAIDFARCDGESCAKCVEVCPYDAVVLDEKERTEKIVVGSVVVATGWKPYRQEKLESLGAGKIANVIRNVEMERLASPDGPTGGRIRRPSDGAEPTQVAFVQCAGSRDELHLAHCSAVCCLASFKQARYVLDQDPAAEVTIFYIDRRAPGRLEDFLQQLEQHERVRFVKGKVARIEEEDSGDVTLTAEDTLSGDKVNVTAGLAVLAVGMVPESTEARFPPEWETDEQGFLAANDASVGIFPAGCAKRPGEVSACVRDATGAALRTLQCARG